MTNGMSGADISSLLYVKSNTFKMERKKNSKREIKNKKKTKNILHLQRFCTSNKGKHSKLRWQPTVYHTCLSQEGTSISIQKGLEGFTMRNHSTANSNTGKWIYSSVFFCFWRSFRVWTGVGHLKLQWNRTIQSYTCMLKHFTTMKT